MHLPANLSDLQNLVRTLPHLRPVGAGTKAPLLRDLDAKTELVSTRNLSGILEYNPGEYTITVRAGTPLAEIQAALALHGQYLPFDPPLASLGATVAGTVAAGWNGPGAYRYGSMRDFLVGVQIVDGGGNLVRGGGKVVKNAAGFDVPKFLVGSAGRFGILTELTFKVFPEPPARRTLVFPCVTLTEVLELQRKTLRSVWEPEALEIDFAPTPRFLLRLAGRSEALDARTQRIAQTLGRTPELLIDADAKSYWQGRLDYAWVPSGHTLWKLPVTPGELQSWHSRWAAESWPHTFGLGGNVAWVATPLDQVPAPAALAMLGAMPTAPVSPQAQPVIYHRVQAAFVGK